MGTPRPHQHRFFTKPEPAWSYATLVRVFVRIQRLWSCTSQAPPVSCATPPPMVRCFALPVAVYRQSQVRPRISRKDTSRKNRGSFQKCWHVVLGGFAIAEKSHMSLTPNAHLWMSGRWRVWERTFARAGGNQAQQKKAARCVPGPLRIVVFRWTMGKYPIQSPRATLSKEFRGENRVVFWRIFLFQCICLLFRNTHFFCFVFCSCGTFPGRFILLFITDRGPLRSKWQQAVNRTPSHREFSRTFAHISSLFPCTAWLKVSHDVSS